MAVSTALLRDTPAVLLAAILLAACGGSPSDGADEEGAAEESASDEETEEEPQPFTIAFGGDVHFEGVLRDRLNQDPQTAMGSIGETFAEADISMVNLETAVTERGTPANKAFTFRAPPSAYTALQAAEVDVASVANNHGMDYGEQGLLDTLDFAEEAEFPVVGIGRNAEEANAPHMMEANGNTVAVFGATDVLDAEYVETWTAQGDQPGMASTKEGALQNTLDAVSAADEEADAVVVYLHWGLEGSHCPLPHAPGLAEQLIDAGADVVVGGHAHVLSPGGYYNGAYVHYGLGNFAFYNFSGPTAETGVLRLTMQGGEVMEDEWLPGQIRGGVPELYSGDQAQTAMETWEGYRSECGIGLNAEPG